MLEYLATAIDAAQKLGTKTLLVLTGNVLPDRSLEDQHRSIVDGMKEAPASQTAQNLLAVPFLPKNILLWYCFIVGDKIQAVGVSPAFSTRLGAVYNTDCFNLFGALKDESVDCVFADPPFNLGKDYGNGPDKDDLEGPEYLKWCFDWIDEGVRVLKPGAAIFVYNLPQWASYAITLHKDTPQWLWTVPTAAQHIGDFSQTVVSGTNGAPTPAGIYDPASVRKVAGQQSSSVSVLLPTVA